MRSPLEHGIPQRAPRSPGGRAHAASPLASLLSLSLLSGCTSLTTLPLQEQGHYRAACALLAENEYAPESLREQLEIEKKELTRRLARDSAVSLSLHALDGDEVTRLLGVAPTPTARYGEDLLVVRVTLDASRSRVPVHMYYFSLRAVDDTRAWIIEDKSSEELKRARGALFGSSPSPAGAPDRGAAGFGPDIAFDFKTFEPLGIFAIHGWALFHLMTGGLVLLSNASSGPPSGGRFVFSPVLRQRDKDVARLTWSPDDLRPASPSPARAAQGLIELEGSVRGCRAEPGESCRFYQLAFRSDSEGGVKSVGHVSAFTQFHLEPACPLEVHSDIPLPPGSTLRERLQALERAGAVTVAPPPKEPKDKHKKVAP